MEPGTAGGRTGGRQKLRPTPIDFGDGVNLSRRSLVLVVMVALVPVISAIGVVLILSVGTGQPVAPPADTTDLADGGAEPGQGSGGDEQDGDEDDGGSGGSARGAEEADEDDAADALRDAGAGRAGSVEGAWTWRDGDTETLVVVTRRVTRRNGDFSARAATLRAFTVADPAGSPKILASFEDAGPTCPRGVEVDADLDPRDVAVLDLDGDGVREAVVGWAHGCADDVRRRVTVLSGSAAYTLAGRGAVLAEPDPPLADWPDGFLDHASQALDSAG